MLPLVTPTELQLLPSILQPSNTASTNSGTKTSCLDHCNHRSSPLERNLPSHHHNLTSGDELVRIRQVNLQRITIDRLILILGRLNQDVDITITTSPKTPVVAPVSS